MKIQITDSESMALARYWNEYKNRLVWSTVCKSSRKCIGRFWWRCPNVSEHEWQMTIPYMLLAFAHDLNCPFCASLSVRLEHGLSATLDEETSKEPSLEQSTLDDFIQKQAEEARVRAIRIVLKAEREREQRAEQECRDRKLSENRRLIQESQIKEKLEIIEQRSYRKHSKQLKKSIELSERRRRRAAKMLEGPMAEARLKLQAERKVFVPLEVHLGRAIRSARRQAYLSKKQLADNVGISVQSLSQIELGDPDLSAKSLFAIKSALKITGAELLDMVPPNCEPF